MRTRTHTGRRSWVGLLAGLAVAAITATPARAGFTVSLDSITPLNPNFAFNYSATITADDQIGTGNFFRIYDFAGFVSATAPAGWSVSMANLDPPPPPNVILSSPDNPALPNVTYTYTAAAAINGPAEVAGFQIVSTLDSTTLDNFAGRATNLTTTNAVDSVGDVRVPAGGPLPVPAPASIVAAGLGALGLGAGLRCRNRWRTPTPA